MIQVKIDGIDELRAGMNDLISDKFPSILAKSLTLTAGDAKEQASGWMPRVLDKPARWTMNSLFVFPAEKSEANMPGGIMAGVAFKHEMGRMPRSALRGGVISAPAAMRAQTYGGSRSLKGSEKTLKVAGILPSGMFMVPAVGAPRDSYGNVTGSFMNKVLYGGVTMGSASQGYSAPVSGEKYFVLYLQPSFRQGAVGIYKRMSRGQQALPVFLFVRSVSYKSRFPFESIVNGAVARNLQRRFDESVAAIAAKYFK